MALFLQLDLAGMLTINGFVTCVILSSHTSFLNFCFAANLLFELVPDSPASQTL